MADLLLWLKLKRNKVRTVSTTGKKAAEDGYGMQSVVSIDDKTRVLRDNVSVASSYLYSRPMVQTAAAAADTATECSSCVSRQLFLRNVDPSSRPTGRSC